MGKGETVKNLLDAVGVPGMDVFDLCSDVNEEFAKVKSFYKRRCLAVHPDKGGTAEVFREVNNAFETLRSMFEKGKIQSFKASQTTKTRKEYDASWRDYEAGGFSGPSYDWYEMQAEEADYPAYRVEVAKSGRSACNKPGTRTKNYQDKKCPIDEDTEYKVKTVTRKLKSGYFEDQVAYTLIKKGMLRLGMRDDQTFGYGRWCHLACWRVPKKIWLAMPQEGSVDATNPDVFLKRLLSLNEVLFCGLNELDDAQRAEIVTHVMDRGNWAQYGRGKATLAGTGPSPSTPKKSPAKIAPKTEPKAETRTPPSSLSGKMPKPADAPASPSAARVLALSKEEPGAELEAQASPAKAKFVLLRPGVGRAKPGCMAGKTCVLTGIFPEVGGGGGLSLGKDRVKSMIESFGGRVTGSVSGKTDVLVVGKEPGMSKVSKARKMENCSLLNLESLCDGINNDEVVETIEGAEPMVIENFSMGYKRAGVYNSLAYRSTPEEIAHAKGLSPKKLEQSESSKRKAEEEAEQAAQAKKKKQKKAKKTARKVDLDEAEDQEKEKPPPPPLSDFIKEKLKRNKEVSCPISILFSFPFSP